MVNAFQGAPGWNNTGGLQSFPESPDFDGIAFPRLIDLPNGYTLQDGAAIAFLRFPDIMKESVAVATLAVLGFGSTWFADTSLKVTVRLPDPNMTTFRNYNAYARRWNPGDDIRHAYCWYERPVIRLKRLVEI